MHEDEIRELAQLERELHNPLRSSHPEYNEAELRAIRQRAVDGAASRSEAGTVRGAPWWSRHRTAVSVMAAAAALLVAGVFSWNGHSQSSAFAVALAAETLLPSTQALHFTEIVTEQNPRSGGIPPLAYEHWIAPEGAAGRSSMSLASSGRPLRITVTQGPGGRSRSGEYEGYARALGYPADPSESKPSPTPDATPRLALVDDEPVEAWPVAKSAPSSDDPKSPVRWWLDLRADLKSGKAKVLGTETHDGKRYWHVRSADATFSPMPTFDESGRWVVPTHPDPGAPRFKRTIDALLQVGDYRPTQAVITLVENFPDPGYDAGGTRQPQFYTETTRFDISSWQAVPLGDVPTGTFDPSSISATGSPSAKFIYRAHELQGFNEFPAWVLPEDSPLKVGTSRLRPQLDMPGNAVYDRGSSPRSVTINPRYTPSLTQLPPDGFETLSNRRLTAIYVFGDNTSLNALVGSMPKATSASIDRFLGSKSRMGRSVSGEVNGLRYRGVEALDLTGGVAVVDAGDATVVVAYAQSDQSLPSPLEAIVAALRRANP